jgi:predicted  nucleic acid-binding Zn-ribbon protein
VQAKAEQLHADLTAVRRAAAEAQRRLENKAGDLESELQDARAQAEALSKKLKHTEGEALVRTRCPRSPSLPAPFLKGLQHA